MLLAYSTAPLDSAEEAKNIGQDEKMMLLIKKKEVRHEVRKNLTLFCKKTWSGIFKHPNYIFGFLKEVELYQKM